MFLDQSDCLPLVSPDVAFIVSLSRIWTFAEAIEGPTADKQLCERPAAKGLARADASMGPRGGILSRTLRRRASVSAGRHRGYR